MGYSFYLTKYGAPRLQGLGIHINLSYAKVSKVAGAAAADGEPSIAVVAGVEVKNSIKTG